MNFIFIIFIFHISHNNSVDVSPETIENPLHEVSKSSKHYYWITLCINQCPLKTESRALCVCLDNNHIYWETRNCSTSNELHLYINMCICIFKNLLVLKLLLMVIDIRRVLVTSGCIKT